MRPPEAHGAAFPAGWRGPRAARPRPRLPGAIRLRRAGQAALAIALVAIAAATLTRLASSTPVQSALAPGAGASRGTAFLGTTTCANWQRASVGRRLTIVGMLGVAATQPDPENAGATLSEGDAYGVFQRICSPGAPPSTLLYEAYNRAASFRSIRP